MKHQGRTEDFAIDGALGYSIQWQYGRQRPAGLRTAHFSRAFRAHAPPGKV